MSDTEAPQLNQMTHKEYMGVREYRDRLNDAIVDAQRVSTAFRDLGMLLHSADIDKIIASAKTCLHDEDGKIDEYEAMLRQQNAAMRREWEADMEHYCRREGVGC